VSFAHYLCFFASFGEIRPTIAFADAKHEFSMAIQSFDSFLSSVRIFEFLCEEEDSLSIPPLLNMTVVIRENSLTIASAATTRAEDDSELPGSSHY